MSSIGRIKPHRCYRSAVSPQIVARFFALKNQIYSYNMHGSKVLRGHRYRTNCSDKHKHGKKALKWNWHSFFPETDQKAGLRKTDKNLAPFQRFSVLEFNEKIGPVLSLLSKPCMRAYCGDWSACSNRISVRNRHS